jgi:hypothetical protein
MLIGAELSQHRHTVEHNVRKTSTLVYRGSLVTSNQKSMAMDGTALCLPGLAEMNK